ncbi:MAG: uroporphyrinogen-III synthase [Alloprevotella sp.]|nr:uroporphyrinogen-III synthase [Alloprevotella sp.]
MIKKILVSQPEPASPKSPYYDLAEKYGVELVFHPFIKVEGIPAKEFRQQKIQILDYTAIVFTSRHAIDHFFTLCKELRVNIPENMKYFGISETVALYIQKYVQYRKRKVFFGTTGKWPELISVMLKHKAEKYLIPLSDVNTGDITAMLNTKKIVHKECVMYRTVSNQMPKSLRSFDMIILFTPSGVESLLKNYPKFRQGKLRIGCWGKATAKAIVEAGLRLDLEAPSEEAPSMTGSLELFLEREEKADKAAAKKTGTPKKAKTTAKKAAPAKKKAEKPAEKAETPVKKAETVKAAVKRAAATATKKAAAPKKATTTTKKAATPKKAAATKKVAKKTEAAQ